MHDTRHTFITALEQSAVDSSTTRSFSGHTKETMMKRYAHATQDSRAKALQIIEKEFGNVAKDHDEDELKNIFEAVAAGKMKYEEFKKAVRFFYGFLT